MDIAPKLDDLFCFYQAVGHWAELSPGRSYFVANEPSTARFGSTATCSAPTSGTNTGGSRRHISAVGQPARLRLDVKHARERMGDGFKGEWMPLLSSNPGDHAEQREHYQALMHILGNEVRGVP